MKSVFCVVIFLAVIGVGGCGVDTSNVDERCQAGAPCNDFDYYTGFEWFKKNYPVVGLDEEQALMGSGYDIRVLQFEKWYFNGVYNSLTQIKASLQ